MCFHPHMRECMCDELSNKFYTFSNFFDFVDSYHPNLRVKTYYVNPFSNHYIKENQKLRSLEFQNPVLVNYLHLLFTKVTNEKNLDIESESERAATCKQRELLMFL
jgi:hypothetical protein